MCLLSPISLSVICNWRKQTVLLDTSASPSQWCDSVIDLFNAHFIAGNPPLRIFQKADRVVMGNPLAEKRENYRTEITSTQSSKRQPVSQSPGPFWLGWNSWLNFLTSPRVRCDRNKKETKNEQVGIFVTKHKIRQRCDSLLALWHWDFTVIDSCFYVVTHTVQLFLLQAGGTQVLQNYILCFFVEERISGLCCKMFL